MKRYLITGGFGFIGSNLLRKLGENPLNEIMVVDCLTYAAQPEWAYAAFKDRNKFHFENQDIFRSKRLASTVVEFNPDVIIHLAAESHVCRSIEGPHEFFETNIMGTFKMLEAARKLKERGSNAVFHHVSTDEVFGELDAEGKFDIQSPYAPRSPYAASKASSDHLVNSYFHTYGINTRISNCSNNFGPNQHAEKLIPKTIERALAGRAATIYSPGTQVRDWIWVDDHVDGILAAIANGTPGGQYLFGGDLERTNLQVVEDIAEVMGVEIGIQITGDRPHDDARYAISNAQSKIALGWAPKPELYMKRLKQTVNWYKERK